MAEHVEAALLDVVDEGDEADAAARVGDHQQNLRPPELDVVLPHVQHQQVLTHLWGRGGGVNKMGCYWEMCPTHGARPQICPPDEVTQAPPPMDLKSKLINY